MTEQTQEKIPSGMKWVGIAFLNIIIFIAYAMVFQLVVGFALGLLEAFGVLAPGTVTDNSESMIFTVIGIISFLIPLGLVIMARSKFFLSINK